ncbi:hypothetical protein GCM10008014_50290 [Paenibacillus silvae]|uniref:Tn3 transposase DDE domain-containing protein n=1 Tax=Paenibacillus silvae TaxID=1325358 RepID=A0ABQ1ZKW9_9BACL|nr:hypothetical protein GCM10008014_50290 [Paenibacillus silvae]
MDNMQMLECSSHSVWVQVMSFKLLTINEVKNTILNKIKGSSRLLTTAWNLFLVYRYVTGLAQISQKACQYPDFNTTYESRTTHIPHVSDRLDR